MTKIKGCCLNEKKHWTNDKKLFYKLIAVSNTHESLKKQHLDRSQQRNQLAPVCLSCEKTIIPIVIMRLDKRVTSEVSGSRGFTKM